MKNRKAQSMIEFCFASTVMMLLLFGMIQTVRWIMLELAETRYDSDVLLTRGNDVQAQLNPYFHLPRPMDATLHKKGP